MPIQIVRAACNSARQNPAEENTFPQLRFNQWVKWQHPRGELSLRFAGTAGAMRFWAKEASDTIGHHC